MKLSFLTAARLRVILLISIGLIFAATVGVFYLAYGRLTKSAAETGSQVASALESKNSLEKLQTLKKDLDSKQTIINRTSQIVADSKNYTYQDRIINDITVYASRANLSITTITFAANQATSGSAAATTPAGGAIASTGLKTATVSVTLANPVNYTDILNFLHYIEQNLTRLKISKVSLQKSSEGNSVTTDVLNLEVNVR